MCRAPEDAKPAMAFDEQMSRLDYPAAKLQLPHQDRLQFRHRAQQHMLKFFKTNHLPKIAKSRLEIPARLLGDKFLLWHGIELWEAPGSAYNPLTSAEEDPVLRKALMEYFLELLQLPLLPSSTTKAGESLKNTKVVKEPTGIKSGNEDVVMEDSESHEGIEGN